MNLVHLVLLSIAFSTAGCAVAVQPQLPVYLGSKKVFDKNYQVGKSQFANVGEPVVKIKAYTLDRVSSQLMRATDDFTLSGGIVTIVGKKAVNYPVTGQVSLEGRGFSVVLIPATSGGPAEPVNRMRHFPATDYCTRSSLG